MDIGGRRVEDAHKIKKFICILIMIIITQKIFSDDGIFISNMSELEEKQYMADIELVIIYNTNSNNMIYKYVTASFKIINLYADGNMINSIDDELSVSENIFLREYVETDVVRKVKILEYRPASKSWFIFVMPQGDPGHLKSYYIPWITRELRIVYEILFPGNHYSERKEVVLKIRNLEAQGD